MNRSRRSWKQANLTKALKGALAAGLTPTQAMIRDDGTVVINFTGGLEVERNDWDDVLRGGRP